MPNHVHVILVSASNQLIGNIVKSWKQTVALTVNRALDRSGPVFAPDYFDRYVRNLAQAEKAIIYVEANPVKAGLCERETDWPWSSAYAKANGWLPRHDRLPVFLE